MTRNPPWSEAELILALDLYIRSPKARTDKRETALVEVSQLLRSLGRHQEQPDPSRFRNVNSVYLKLQNFKAIDPAYDGVGMRAGATKLARDIWDQYAADGHALAMAANRIRLDIVS